jgi:CheY-like chemotaxis protein
MPGMSGFELLEHINEEFAPAKPEVYMITAYGDQECYNQAKSLGARDLLTKPLDFSLLREMLHINQTV